MISISISMLINASADAYLGRYKRSNPQMAEKVFKVAKGQLEKEEEAGRTKLTLDEKLERLPIEIEKRWDDGDILLKELDEHEIIVQEGYLYMNHESIKGLYHTDLKKLEGSEWNMSNNSIPMNILGKATAPISDKEISPIPISPPFQTFLKIQNIQGVKPEPGHQPAAGGEVEYKPNLFLVLETTKDPLKIMSVKPSLIHAKFEVMPVTIVTEDEIYQKMNTFARVNMDPKRKVLFGFDASTTIGNATGYFPMSEFFFKRPGGQEELIPFASAKAVMEETEKEKPLSILPPDTMSIVAQYIGEQGPTTTS